MFLAFRSYPFPFFVPFFSCLVLSCSLPPRPCSTCSSLLPCPICVPSNILRHCFGMATVKAHACHKMACVSYDFFCALSLFLDMFARFCSMQLLESGRQHQAARIRPAYGWKLSCAEHRSGRDRRAITDGGLSANTPCAGYRIQQVPLQ